jgi:acyl carrier protein
MFKRLFGQKTSVVSTTGAQEFLKIKETILEISPELKSYNIHHSTTFIELGFNSLMYMSLILSLGDITGKDLEEVATIFDPYSIQTVNDLVEFVLLMKSSD